MRPKPLRQLSVAECRAFRKRVFANPEGALRERIAYPRRAEFDIRVPDLVMRDKEGNAILNSEGKHQLDPEKQEAIHKVVHAFSEMLTRLLHQHDLEPGDAPYDHALAVRESIKNAIYHGSKDPETGFPNPEKTIVLRWILERQRTKSGAPQKYKLNIHVRDQGPGIQAHETHRPEIFQGKEIDLEALDKLTPEEVEAVMSGKGFGLGKGLSIIRELCEQRNGKEEHKTGDLRWVTTKNGERHLVPSYHTHKMELTYHVKASD